MTPVGQRWVLRLWGHGDFCSTCKDLSVCRVSSKSHGGSFPIEPFPYPDNGTFGDLCRSNGGSYTTSGPWGLLFNMQRSISTPIFIKIARGEISRRLLAMSFLAITFSKSSVIRYRRT